MSNRIIFLLLAGWTGIAFLLLVGCNGVLLPDPDVQYIAFGDSSTTGTEDGRDYPDLLREMLGVGAEKFVNQGKGGETSSEGLSRLNTLLSAGIYPNATTLLYWEGGNDVIDFLKDADPFLLASPSDSDYPFTAELTSLLDASEASISAAIAAGRGAGLAVYVATYPLRPLAMMPCNPLFIPLMLPAQAAHANEYTVLLNDRIRLATASGGVVLVDVAAETQLAGSTTYWENCNHLNEQGNTVAAGVFAGVFNATSQPG